jgi:hypothetical protein
MTTSHRSPAALIALTHALAGGVAATPALAKPAAHPSATARHAAIKPAPAKKKPASKPAAQAQAQAEADAARQAWLALAPNVARLAQWVRITSDHQGQPFAIIDKQQARLYVFDAQGSLKGNAPILLGLAQGDDTVPGIGERPLSEVMPSERTTPAGRFVSEHGTNARGEHVIWIDYDAAVSMHPVLTTNPAEHRLQRLASPEVDDNRISYGCVNVPTAFVANVVLKTLTADNPVVYVLPETHAMSDVFAGFPEGTVPHAVQHASVQALGLR